MNDSKDRNVIDITTAKHRIKKKLSSHNGEKNPKPQGHKNNRIWQIMQFGLFMLILYYGLKLCHSG